MGRELTKARKGPSRNRHMGSVYSLWITNGGRKSMRLARILAPVAIAAPALSLNAFAADITGAGAPFPYPIDAKRADAYKKNTGHGMNYQCIRSAAGMKQITAQPLEFCPSAMPIKTYSLHK